MDRSVTNNYQELAEDESRAEGPKLQLWRCRRVLCVLTLLNPDDIHTNPLTAVVWASRQVTLTSPRILKAAYEQHRGELLPSEPEDVTGNQVTGSSQTTPYNLLYRLTLADAQSMMCSLPIL